jgi:membrane dipeptidase
MPSVRSAAELARALGCSAEAVALTRDATVVDLHLDTFIVPRLWGYDPLVRHERGPFGHRFFGHADVPRLADGGVDGAMWSITTNPFRRPARRWRTFRRNLAALRALIGRSAGAMAEVRTRRDFEAARARGAHGCFVAIQGLNAVTGAPGGVRALAGDDVLRATLVHLTDSLYGATSSPLGLLRRDKGLTSAGREAVAHLNAERILVDLAHIHARAFWDAVAAHDRSQPLIATHTGVSGVRPHWRNLDDAQLRAVADTGGVVGIIFATEFLRRPDGPRDGRMIVEHLAHVCDVAGEDAAGIGTDWDGAIVTPPDLGSADTLPRLVQYMLDAGFSETRVRKILGGNFLRALGMLRPG